MTTDASPGSNQVRRSKKQRTAGEPGGQDQNGPSLGTEATSLPSPSSVLLSPSDRAPQTTITNGLTLSSSRGYRSVRATHGVASGTWYYEVRAESLGQTGAARIGWTTTAAELQGPVGGDAAGYAYRSLEGSKVHAGVREEYGDAWGEGDVAGCLISLPPGPAKSTGSGDSSEGEESSGYVAFFKNGVPQGKAYVDIPAATYYPTISLYTHAGQPSPARTTVNFGATPLAFAQLLEAELKAAGAQPVSALGRASAEGQGGAARGSTHQP